MPYYEHALNMILDFEDQEYQLPEDQQPLVETVAQMLSAARLGTLASSL